MYGGVPDIRCNVLMHVYGLPPHCVHHGWKHRTLLRKLEMCLSMLCNAAPKRRFLVTQPESCRARRAGCEFQVIEAPLEEPVLGYYKAAAKMWNQLRREFLYAAEQARPLIPCTPGCRPRLRHASLLTAWGC